MKNKSAEQWIAQLDLESHPEGGYYKRIYESDLQTNHNQTTRPISTSIHYLLQSHDYSAWHRIQSDEQWFFHAGNALTIYEINSNGELRQHTLGSDHSLSCVIPAQSWFCAHSDSDSHDAYSLVSCAVSPGFIFDEFELAKSDELSAQFPEYKELIHRYCRQ